MARRFTIGWMVAAVVYFLIAGPVVAAPELFPQYPVIDPNVSFWTNVYARYTTAQAVVHDSVHLDIVYDVIDLQPIDQPGARKSNRKRMKRARQRIAGILKRLATDPKTDDTECRRVAALFGPQADAAAFSKARRRVRCQIGQRDRFRAGLIRSGAYLDQMRSILKSYGVPADLAYLPHVESSFNTKAYSKFGAAGIWQFTRSTGKRFMTVDYVLDERRDPITATHAAARLLKENHEKLGSWPLAITAYNHGAAGMRRAKTKHGGYPEVFKHYKGRTFKFASRNFYAEFLAARQVAADYRRYFGELVLQTPRTTRSLRLTGFAAFPDLCSHFNVSPKVARALNPALRPPVFSGQKYVPKGYVFNLPAPAASTSARVAALPAGLIKRAQKPSRFYTVQRGDTAGKIARRHRVKLNDLILANGLDRRATVYVRQRLRIPQAGELIRPAVRTEQPGRAAPAVQRTAPVVATLGLPVENAVLRYRRPGPAPADLLADTAPATIPVEPTFPVNPDVVVAGIGFERIDPAPDKTVGIIRVEVEETLGHYAEWAGVRASRIRHLNGLTYGRPLHLNQVIKIPLTRVAADQFESRRYEFHKRLQEDFYTAYRVGEIQRYRVRPGDSYWTLCREKFDLPLWLLKQYNADVNLATLRVHQPLTIPSVESVLVNTPHPANIQAVPDA